MGQKLTKDDLKRMNLAPEDELTADSYPALYNISSAFLYDFMPVPKTSCPMPEFVFVDPSKMDGPRQDLVLHEWNMAWEAGQLRCEMFEDKLPASLAWLKHLENNNVYLLPLQKQKRYYAYMALYHLLPRKTLERFGLPCLQKGVWPLTVRPGGIDEVLPRDFDARFARAFAFHIWPLLNSGSRIQAFSETDPVKILSYNLDFWLPYAFRVAENRLNSFPRTDIEDDKQAKRLKKAKKSAPSDIQIFRPLKGGMIWQGEDEAWEATKEMVEHADGRGRLRSILDAVSSNRVEEDFSGCWSNAREDFERKLYKKRSKVKVSFVELDDTIPVHGPDSEYSDNLVWEDFFGLLDSKEKRIVVCLKNGTTKLGDIAKEMGYSNHSPISKALSRIRNKAVSLLTD